MDAQGSRIVLIGVGGTGIFTMITFLNNSGSETKVTMDLDKIRNTGNKCPGGFGYVGGGYCKNVICTWDLVNDWRLGGKGYVCKRAIF